MKEKYYIVNKSSNKKTGKMVVVTSSAYTCPDACPFKNNGCYADLGPLGMHWKKLSCGEIGIDFDDLIKKIKEIPR